MKQQQSTERFSDSVLLLMKGRDARVCGAGSMTGKKIIIVSYDHSAGEMRVC